MADPVQTTCMRCAVGCGHVQQRPDTGYGLATVEEYGDAVPPGLVWLPIHHPMTNHLTVDAVDPDSEEPNYKQCAVALVAPDAVDTMDGRTRGADAEVAS